MNIKDYFSEDLILMDLQSRRRETLFMEMTERLEQLGYLTNAAEVVRMLMERERLGSTGMEGGFAIPHVYMEQVPKSMLMMGISKAGIDFHTHDQEPVFVVFLLLGPPSHRTEHVRLLARISRALRRENLIEAIQKSESPAKVIELICL